MTDLTGLRRFAAGLPFLLIFFSFFAGVAPQTAVAQGVIKSKHGDWEIRCETPPGAQHEQCALLQSVAAEDRQTSISSSSSSRRRTARAGSCASSPRLACCCVRAGAQIDSTDVGRAGFVRCLPTGCVAEVVMDDKLIGELRNGHMPPLSSSRPRRRDWHSARAEWLRRRVRCAAVKPVRRKIAAFSEKDYAVDRLALRKIGARGTCRSMRR